MVKTLYNDLNTKFLGESDWFSPFFSDISDPKTLDEETLKAFLQVSLIDAASLICKSILEGEYIKENEEFDTLLSQVIESCQTIYSKILFLESTEIHSYTDNFSKLIKDVCSNYIKFYKQISIHLSNPNIEIVFSATKEDFGESMDCYKFYGEDIGNSFRNVFLLLGLCTYDHFFNESIDYFKRLIHFENQVESSDSLIPYIGAIKDKILFLKYKWGVRQITTAKFLKNNISKKSYIIDNDIISIHQNPEFTSTTAKLKYWKEYLDNHYSYIEHSNYFTVDKVIDTDPNFLELHYSIKFYKDVKPNYDNLKKVIENFEKKEIDFKDQKSLYVKNLNYALNNQFSMLIDSENIKDEDVLGLKKKIDSLQDKVGYDNFFVDFKYLIYNIKKLNKIISSRIALENQKEIMTLISQIRGLIISCEKKIEWSENHHNLLYQLPYKESLVSYDTDDVKNVYYASTFLLPLSVEQTNKEFFDLKLEFQNKYNHIEILSTLDKEFSIIKELREKAEMSDKRSIETLTIFTAIISFIVGTVSGFSFIDSFVKAIIFLIIFSTSLFTFVLLIFVSTKSSYKILNYKLPILIMYLSIIGLLIGLFSYKNKFDDKFELEKARLEKEIGNKKYIDSIDNIQNSEITKLKTEIRKVYKNTTPQKQGGRINSKTNDN